MTVKGQRFAEITDVSGLGLGYALGKFDGILGLGFRKISIDNTKTWLDNIFEQDPTLEQVFAFKLSNVSGKDGELIIGGIDKNHYTGDITYVKLSNLD